MIIITLKKSMIINDDNNYIKNIQKLHQKNIQKTSMIIIDDNNYIENI